MRYPVAAGYFYEADKGKLLKQIEGCFLSKFGPGELPQKHAEMKKENGNSTDSAKVFASAIVPHAGYTCSGMCAAFAYRKLHDFDCKPNTIIILGTDHTGNGSGLSIEDWKTPLGTVKTDKQLCNALVDGSDLEINENSHSDEHSIEVQLPFLQYIYNHLQSHDFKIVPITVSFDTEHKKTAESIFNLIKAQNESQKREKYAIIASGDFTHYGHNYGYVPFRENIKENIERLDAKAIDLILKSDSKGFIDHLNKTKDTICGKVGFSVLIELNKLLSLKGRLLKYYTSGDVFGDYKNSVSYASIICTQHSIKQ